MENRKRGIRRWGGEKKKSLVVAMATRGERFQSGLGHYAVCWGAGLCST